MVQRILHVAGPDQFLPPARQIACTEGSLFWQAPNTTWIGGVRTAFKAQLAKGVDHVVFHDGWGLEFLAACAATRHRSVYLHTRFSFLDRALPQWLRFAGTVFVHSDRLVDRNMQGLRWIPANRLPVLQYPSLPHSCPDSQPGRGSLLRIGLAGWLVRHRHRLDLWPDFLKLLQSLQVDFKVTVIGEGRGLRWLRKSLRQYPVEFIACDDPAHFAQLLSQLDLMLTFSSLEADAWALQQAANAGLAVSFPAEQYEADSGASALYDTALPFAPGQAEDAANRICDWWSRSGGRCRIDLAPANCTAHWDECALRPSPATPVSTVPGWLPLNVYRAMRDYWLTGKFY